MTLHRQSEGKLGEAPEERCQGPQKKKQILPGSKVGQELGEPWLLRAQRRDKADFATHQLQRPEMTASVGTKPPSSRISRPDVRTWFLTLDQKR